MRAVRVVLGLGLGTLALVAVLVLQSSSGGRSDPPTDAVDTVVVDITPTSWGDVQPLAHIDPDEPGLVSYASEFGLTPQQARANLLVQGEIGRRAPAMIEAAGDGYRAISHGNDALATVRLHTADIESARRMVAAYVESGGPPARFVFIETRTELGEVGCERVSLTPEGELRVERRPCS